MSFQAPVSVKDILDGMSSTAASAAYWSRGFSEPRGCASRRWLSAMASRPAHPIGIWVATKAGLRQTKFENFRDRGRGTR